MHVQRVHTGGGVGGQVAVASVLTENLTGPPDGAEGILGVSECPESREDGPAGSVGGVDGATKDRQRRADVGVSQHRMEAFDAGRLTDPEYLVASAGLSA